MRLSLVIPCYNEAASLPGLLARCDEVTGAMDAEVIIVDNGSTDDTSAVLDRLLPEHPGCRLVRVVENRGYGHGIKAGLGAARGEILGWTHADLQTDPAHTLGSILGYHKVRSYFKVSEEGKRVWSRMSYVARAADGTCGAAAILRTFSCGTSWLSRLRACLEAAALRVRGLA